jgi:chemotaxis protein MotA
MANASTAQTGARKQANTARPRRGAALDLATILGTVGAFAMVVAAIVVGGMPGAFLDLRAILIVVGGTFMVTTISFSLREIMRAQSVMLKAIVYQRRDPGETALYTLRLAELARKEGALSLQNHEREFRNERFLARAVAMVIDGAPAEEVERVMNRDAEATMMRHQKASSVIRRAGEVAPAMGLIGTLVGLVQMLGNLEDPSAIGPAMAVALLTTFYGAVLAHMVFIPVANKLDRNSMQEGTVNQIYAQAAASIARQENPRRLETYLNTILPPAERVNYFD